MRLCNKMAGVILLILCIFLVCACNTHKNSDESFSDNTIESESESIKVYDFSNEKNIYKVSSLIVKSVEDDYISMKPEKNNYLSVVLDEDEHIYTCILLPSADTELITKEYRNIVEKHMDEIAYLDSLIEKGYVVQYFSGKAIESHEYETQINENQSEDTIIIKTN